MRIKRFFAAAALMIAAAATAQPYPSRPITMVVPAPPGGATDAIARTLAEELGRRLGQTVVVDNRPGATGTLGVQAVVRARPDGYTLLMSHAAPVLQAPYVMQKVPYDVLRDLALVTQVCSGSLVLAAHASVPAANVKELVAWARKNRGSVSYGDFGIGSNAHLIGAYLSYAQDLGMTHVSYKGEAPMIQDLVAGVVPLAIGTVGAIAPHMAGGRVKVLAVLGERRLPALPNVPTMAEEGFPDAEYKPMAGMYLMAPAGTPAAMLERVEQAARDAVSSAAMTARSQAYGLEPVGSSAAAARRDFEAARPVVERLVKMSGARAE